MVVVASEICPTRRRLASLRGWETLIDAELVALDQEGRRS
jgi:hypothetical protein